MYIKQFEVRWSDIDANRHLANSAYINFMSHTRMSYLNEIGLDQRHLVAQNIGPVVFYEHVYYFKEVFPGKPLRVSLEITGMSDDGMYFEFAHNFYDHNGNNVAHCEMMGAWIDLQTRKLTGLPKEILATFDRAERSAEFRILTKDDTRKHGKTPKSLPSE
ncbi:acyl-CoA thioesterase [Altibacter sp. HG106]|uniref:acyl-CoA thioesterase n=1 Tax=Altibacter sp. HG106 TaxID=3023937 RepID=UPI002350EFE4|nr:thioesterase family protein [Altibacter sp. HG106]MDC7994843.1 thioesterase family protein [Altibacter sp. HG106]